MFESWTFRNSNVAENYLIVRYWNSGGMKIHTGQRHTCNENKLSLSHAAWQHMVVFYIAATSYDASIKLMFWVSVVEISCRTLSSPTYSAVLLQYPYSLFFFPCHLPKTHFVQPVVRKDLTHGLLQNQKKLGPSVLFFFCLEKQI